MQYRNLMQSCHEFSCTWLFLNVIPCVPYIKPYIIYVNCCTDCTIEFFEQWLFMWVSIKSGHSWLWQLCHIFVSHNLICLVLAVWVACRLLPGQQLIWWWSVWKSAVSVLWLNFVANKLLGAGVVFEPLWSFLAMEEKAVEMLHLPSVTPPLEPTFIIATL